MKATIRGPTSGRVSPLFFSIIMPKPSRALSVLATVVMTVAVAGAFSGCGKQQAAKSATTVATTAYKRLPDLPLKPLHSPVLVLGLDGLDDHLVDPMMESGELPTLAKLASGAKGVVNPIPPLISPLLWTSIATGVTADVHGVLDFLQPAGDTVHPNAVTPIMSTSRKVPAVWNMLSAAGRSVAVIGWWATYPAEAVDGTIVSDRVAEQLFAGEHTPGADPYLISPRSETKPLLGLVTRTSDISDQELATYVHLTPQQIAARREKNDPMDPVVQLARLLASTKSYLAIAGHLLDQKRPDVMMLYIEGTDTIGHLFAPFYPPRSPWIDPAKFALYKDAAPVYFKNLDSWLGQLLTHAKGYTVVVCSDHGFYWGKDRPRAQSQTRTPTAAWWHRPKSVYWVSGPSARAGGHGGGSILDEAPTLLTLAGLPVGATMSGHPLEWAIDVPATGTYSYRKNLPPVAAKPPVAPAKGDETSKHFLSKLQALGYVGGGTESTATPNVTHRAQLNLGTVLLDKGDLEGALAAYQAAAKSEPKDAGSWTKIGLVEQRQGDYRRAEAAYRKAVSMSDKQPLEREAAYLGLAITLDKAGKRQEADQVLAQGEKALPHSFILRTTRAGVQKEMGDEMAATHSLEQALAIEPTDTKTLNLLGALYAKHGHAERALPLWRKSLRINPDQPQIKQFVEMVTGQNSGN